jgi:Fe-Mn family superoxide dismutase
MFRLPDLPYPHEALEPVLGAETLRTHHGKHHKRYVDVTNEIVAATPALEGKSMEELVEHAAAEGHAKLFNNAGQSWNHGFFWESMTPSRQPPSGALADAIQRDFGGLDGLRTRFIDEGANHFASGWAWLAARGETLEVLSTHDADTVVTRQGLTPLLLCDVWEHAYYLDWKNDRKSFLEQWFDKLANWRFAEAQYEAARGGGRGWRYPQ